VVRNDQSWYSLMKGFVALAGTWGFLKLQTYTFQSTHFSMCLLDCFSGKEESSVWGLTIRPSNQLLQSETGKCCPKPQFPLKPNNENERTTCGEINHKLLRHVSRIEPRLCTDNFGCQVKKKQKKWEADRPKMSFDFCSENVHFCEIFLEKSGKRAKTLKTMLIFEISPKSIRLSAQQGLLEIFTKSPKD